MRQHPRDEIDRALQHLSKSGKMDHMDIMDKTLHRLICDLYNVIADPPYIITCDESVQRKIDRINRRISFLLSPHHHAPARQAIRHLMKQINHDAHAAKK